MKINKRQMILGVALLLTVIAVILAPPLPEAEVVQAKREYATNRTDHAKKPKATSKQSNYKLVEKREWATEKGRDLFAVKRKALPKPAVLRPQVMVAPPKPTAPPLPFKYMGKVVEDGDVTVFLAKQQRHYLLNGGETIGHDYRVDRVEADKVVFTYLPLKEEQVMVFGETN